MITDWKMFSRKLRSHSTATSVNSTSTGLHFWVIRLTTVVSLLIHRRPHLQEAHQLRRFLGMANQVGKFTPNLAGICQPLCGSSAWLWSPPQDEAFEKLKKELVQPTVLVLYNLNAELKIPADISL